MKWLRISLFASLLLLALAAPALAAGQVRPQGQGAYLYGTPPRYQIFYAPKPYGGLIMVDTKDGSSYQRVIVNTKKGIEIRWLKLKQVDGIPAGETILWN